MQDGRQEGRNGSKKQHRGRPQHIRCKPKEVLRPLVATEFVLASPQKGRNSETEALKLTPERPLTVPSSLPGPTGIGM